MTPFILKGATEIPPEIEPTSEHTYDPQQQIWIDNRTGVPLVISSIDHNDSRFGETTLTETREGADQSESISIYDSRFGETTLTKTREGADQGEGAVFGPTRFGETTHTATAESTDNPEIATAQQLEIDAPYSHF